MKIVAFIGAGLLILFGALMAIGATDPYNGQVGWLPVGLVLIGVGLVIIFFAARRKPVDPTTNVTLNVDLPGNVAMDEIKCKSCGGVLALRYNHGARCTHGHLSVLQYRLPNDRRTEMVVVPDLMGGLK